MTNPTNLPLKEWIEMPLADRLRIQALHELTIAIALVGHQNAQLENDLDEEIMEELGCGDWS